MIEFSGCGLENKYVIEQNQNNVDSFFSHVIKNNQVRSVETEKLENELLKFGKCSDAKSRLVGSATDGLFFSLLCSDLKVGSKIGVTAYSFHASASCIVRAGFVPVFIDVDKNGLMDLDKFEEIADSLDGAIVVQLFGSLIDEKRLINICSNFNIKFIEDAAQRHIYSKTLLNSNLCISSVLSFDPFKIFSGIGTGGAVITKKQNIAKKITELHYHGNRCNRQGYNSQISECSAWLIRKKIENFYEWQNKRKSVANEYNKSLCKFETKLRTIVNKENINEHSLHKYVIVFNNKLDRDYIENKLVIDNIKTMVHYRYILPELKLFEKFTDNNMSSKFFNSKHLSENSLSLPIHPFINSNDLLKIIERFSYHLEKL